MHTKRRHGQISQKRAWSARSKMVRYVLLRPMRPELDGQDVEVLKPNTFANFEVPAKIAHRNFFFGRLKG
jgi:hypothetical protein